MEEDFINKFIEKPKILMVDDRPENLVVLERLLKNKPLDLYKANSGNEALKLTLHHDFALALLDIQMPEMDGYELAEIFRSEEKTSRMPFIFISAIYTDYIHVFKGYEKGAFSFITKPFEPIVLLSKIEFFIEKHQHEQALKQTQLILKEQVKQRTYELEMSNRELQISNRELEQFAYIASHDLQEPLRTVISYTNLLVKKYDPLLDEKGKVYTSFITDATLRMSNLIKGVLDYSRIGSNREVLSVNCNTLLKEIEDDLSTVISDANAIIIKNELPIITGYPTELRLLFQNLMSNAIKFHKPDVTPEIIITAEDKDKLWQFSIQDNGIGIDSNHLERIFIIFQRLHNRNEYDGTGIGLAHCRKIVDLHNGNIWVESTANHGSTFYFTITKA